MTDPIDIPALKAAALDPTKHRTHDDRVMMVARSDVLALIERLERAERELNRILAAYSTSHCSRRWEKLEAVAKAAREAADYHKLNLYSDSAAHALLLALAALEDSP